MPCSTTPLEETAFDIEMYRKALIASIHLDDAELRRQKKFAFGLRVLELILPRMVVEYRGYEELIQQEWQGASSAASWREDFWTFLTAMSTMSEAVDRYLKLYENLKTTVRLVSAPYRPDADTNKYGPWWMDRVVSEIDRYAWVGSQSRARFVVLWRIAQYAQDRSSKIPDDVQNAISELKARQTVGDPSSAFSGP
ncbi:hypothetical protein JCM11491_005394 [Sporobolomyces phaffii]